MNKSELAERVAERLNRPRGEVRECLDAALEEILEAIVQGERVGLLGFGTFRREWSPPRRGRNPRTGKLVELHPRFHLRFSAGSVLQKRLKALIPCFDHDEEHLKARRVARTMAADLRLYHLALVEAATRRGRPDEELLRLMASMRERFGERVPGHVTAARDYLEEELAALLRVPGGGAAKLLEDPSLPFATGPDEVSEPGVAIPESASPFPAG